MSQKGVDLNGKADSQNYELEMLFYLILRVLETDMDGFLKGDNKEEKEKKNNSNK